MIYTISNRDKIEAEFYFLLDPTKPKKFSKTIQGVSFNFLYEPYYCGIGHIKNNRPSSHFNPSNLSPSNTNQDKINKINSLIKAGYNPRQYILKIPKELSEAVSLEIESIKIFGRLDKGTGILLNHSNGGEWHQTKLYSPYLEQKHNEKTVEVCEKLNQGLPLSTMEKTWVKAQRGIVKHNKGGVVPPSSLKLIKKLNQPDLFTTSDDEAESNKKTIKVCQWIKANKRMPNVHSKDNEERFSASFINHRRQSKIGNKDFGTWYDSDLDIAINQGLPNIFTIVKDEDLALSKAIQVFDWRDNHSGQIPKYHSDNKEESDLGFWVVKQTQIFNGTGKGNKYPSLLKLEKERGYHNTFSPKNPEGVRKYSKELIINIWNDLNNGMRNIDVAEKYDVPLHIHIIKRVKSKSGIYGKIIDELKD